MGRQISLSVADINVGILYITAIASISVYGIVLAGWSSNNKYAMMGGIRSTAQMISYELALGLGFIGPILLAGSMSMVEIVEAQQEYGWFVVLQPVGALHLLDCHPGEVNRAPFDMPEAEQELTAGYHTEYSGMKFALFFMAEYIKMIAVSAIAATLFFGGYRRSLCGSAVPGWVRSTCSSRSSSCCFGMIWVRATLPRIRYDRLMAFGWKIMLPLALANVFITAIGIYLNALLADFIINLLCLFLVVYMAMECYR